MNELPTNKQPVGETFKTTQKLVVGRCYHIRGMYKGSYFVLLEFGEKYAVLGYPKRYSHRLFAAKVSDLKELRSRS